MCACVRSVRACVSRARARCVYVALFHYPRVNQCYSEILYCFQGLQAACIPVSCVEYDEICCICICYKSIKVGCKWGTV